MTTLTLDDWELMALRTAVKLYLAAPVQTAPVAMTKAQRREQAMAQIARESGDTLLRKIHDATPDYIWGALLKAKLKEIKDARRVARKDKREAAERRQEHVIQRAAAAGTAAVA